MILILSFVGGVYLLVRWFLQSVTWSCSSSPMLMFDMHLSNQDAIAFETFSFIAKLHQTCLSGCQYLFTISERPFKSTDNCNTPPPTPVNITRIY